MFEPEVVLGRLLQHSASMLFVDLYEFWYIAALQVIASRRRTYPKHPERKPNGQPNGIVDVLAGGENHLCALGATQRFGHGGSPTLPGVLALQEAASSVCEIVGFWWRI